ncbi:MAG: nuclear transport factor 2 family protein [Proteobacteria bacterium]|nr:nuclear transport factor 2 family protein [Pseudomonadota bacterium]
MKVFRPGIATLVALSMLVAACAKAPDNLQATLQNYVDRQAIETTLVRYSTGLDTFDADVYASAFTEDAEFAMEGKVFRAAPRSPRSSRT